MAGTGAQEELRLACVFNGGVSLAVWMGGVAHEINELTGEGATYAPLLDLLGVRARADVISGTSAGGINGAALALAQTNSATDLRDLRAVWAEQGRLETLLHRPFTGDPVSLLRGEEVFLPELTRALHRLATPWRPRPVEERPVDLTVTATLLDGVTLEETDSLGQPLTQDRHDVQLCFTRTVDGAGRVHDDFAAPGQEGPLGPAPRGEVVAALGLAARASAGFPVAFEPTLLPVDPAVPVPGRPDMAPYASWRAEPGADGTRPDRSRYAVDGGLLNNTPTQLALAAIERMRAELVVDRVMLLVVPLPAREVVEAGASAERPPTLTGMALGLAASVTSTGNRTFVDEVVRHNRAATSARGTRRDVLTAAGTAASLAATAERLYPHYRRLRLRRDVRDLAAGVRRPAGRAHDRVRADVEAAAGQGAGTVMVPPTLEELTAGGGPGSWAWGSKPLLDMGAAALEYLGALVEAWPLRDHGPVLAARAGVHRALARARWVRTALDTPWDEEPVLVGLPPDRTYWRLRLAVDAWLLRGAPAALDEVDAAAGTVGLDRARVLGPVVRALRSVAPPPHDDGGLAGALLGDALETLLTAVVAPTRPGLRERLGAALPAVLDPVWLPVLDAAALPDDAAARAGTRQLLAWLHVASWTIGDELPTENTNPVRLTQLSAATRNDFATYSHTVDEKLGGASLARFSGFLKRSWRMNDWAWGRFDGATALLRTVLLPRRVRDLAVSRGLSDPHDVVDLILSAAWGEAAAAEVVAGAAGLGRLTALRSEAAGEVAAALRASVPAHLREDGAPDEATMPALASLLAYGRHLAVVHEELPEVARAVVEDAADGANTRSRGEVFRTQHAGLLARLAATREQPGTAAWLRTGLEALAAFDHAGIGREPLDEEGAGDQLIRTAVTAAGVAATVAAGRRSGLGALAPVTRAVKGATMVPYWVTQGLTTGGVVARSLGVLALASGGVLLALALLGLLDGTLAGIAATAGAGVLLAALTYGALRTGSLLHAAVLAAAAAGLGLVGVRAAQREWDLSLGIGAALGVTVLVGGLVVLGSLREPLASPKTVVEDAAVAVARGVSGQRWTGRATTAVRAAGLVVVALVLGAAVVLLVAEGATRLDRLPRWARWVGAGRPWAAGAAVAALAAVAAVAVTLAARGLRRWQRHGEGWRLERSSGAAGAAAGWSVVYGVVALVGCAAVLASWPEGPDVVLPAGWVVAVLAVLAVVLMVPGPLVTLWRARRQVARRVSTALERVGPLPGAGDLATRRAAWLEANGWAYSAVVRVAGDGAHLELRPRASRALGPSRPG